MVLGNGEGGIRTHGAFRHAGFQDHQLAQLLQPIWCHLGSSEPTVSLVFRGCRKLLDSSGGHPYGFCIEVPSHQKGGACTGEHRNPFRE